MYFPAALFAIALAIAPAAVHADDWRSGAYQSRVFTAAIRNSAHAGVDIECRAANYGRSEVIIDLRVPTAAGAKPAESAAMVLAAGQKTTSLTFRLLAMEWGTATYRWIALDPAAYEVARALGDALETAGTLEVKGDGAAMAFSFPPFASGSRASETIRHCGKEAVHARENASGITDPKILQAFWADTNGRCRGGSGDERATWKACDERTAYSERLDALGWCYGKVGQIGADMRWHRCTADSNR